MQNGAMKCEICKKPAEFFIETYLPSMKVSVTYMYCLKHLKEVNRAIYDVHMKYREEGKQ